VWALYTGPKRGRVHKEMPRSGKSTGCPQGFKIKRVGNMVFMNMVTKEWVKGGENTL